MLLFHASAHNCYLEPHLERPFWYNPNGNSFFITEYNFQKPFISHCHEQQKNQHWIILTMASNRNHNPQLGVADSSAEETPALQTMSLRELVAAVKEGSGTNYDAAISQLYEMPKTHYSTSATGQVFITSTPLKDPTADPYQQTLFLSRPVEPDYHVYYANGSRVVFVRELCEHRLTLGRFPDEPMLHLECMPSLYSYNNTLLIRQKFVETCNIWHPLHFCASLRNPEEAHAKADLHPIFFPYFRLSEKLMVLIQLMDRIPLHPSQYLSVATVITMNAYCAVDWYTQFTRDGVLVLPAHYALLNTLFSFTRNVLRRIANGESITNIEQLFYYGINSKGDDGVWVDARWNPSYVDIHGSPLLRKCMCGRDFLHRHNNDHNVNEGSDDGAFNE